MGIFQSAQTWIILAIIVIAAIVFFSTRGDQNQNGSNNQNQNGQEQSTNGNSDSENPNSPVDNGDVEGTDTEAPSGNVTAQGTLKTSDNPARGNLLLDSQSGMIYIKTTRDFSSQIGQEVTMQAQGSLNQFVFLGFAESSVGQDVGGAPDEALSGNVSFSGTLRNSDSSTRGNYMITSGGTNVYLKTVHDYSSLVDSTVMLNATGTLNSFTNATVSKK